MDLWSGKISVEKAVYQWDKVVRCLGIRLNRDGSRNFVAKLSINGKPKWFTIGPVDLISAADARKLVQRMKLLAKAGDDPTSLVTNFQKEDNLTGVDGVTFAQYVRIYIERYAKVHKKSWLKDQQRLDLYAVPKWGLWRLTDISRDDVSKLFAEVSRRGKIGANRLLETLTTLFRQAMLTGYISDKGPLPT